MMRKDRVSEREQEGERRIPMLELLATISSRMVAMIMTPFSPHVLEEGQQDIRLHSEHEVQMN